MSKRESALLSGDILKSAHKILDQTAAQSFDDLIHDSKTVDAIVRKVEIIGDAASRLQHRIAAYGQRNRS